MLRPQPSSPLFPYTTLFRSLGSGHPTATAQSELPLFAPPAADALRQALEAIDPDRSEEHTSELQSHVNLVCRLLLEKKKNHILAQVASDVPLAHHSNPD